MIRFLLLALGLGLLMPDARALDLDDYPKLQLIADELIAEKLYTQSELQAIFDHAEIQQSVLDAMMNPAEYRLTWGKYRKIFLGEERIQQGVEFWAEYEADLTRAEQEYGVPPSVIVSILGVETKFGRIKGKHKVLDSLSSLVVGFPRRSAFFAKELKQFLILTRENEMDATAILGSYAGAVGYPQFISSSYRNYAVDFSGDGVTDLIDQPVDAIGSVANYFVKNGWKPGEPVTSKPHHTVPDAISEIANRKRKTQFTAADLRTKGAKIHTGVDDQEALNVLMLNASEIVPDDEEPDHYIVRAGDTACEIAESHGVSCRSLFKLNKLNSRGAIYRGQRLKLPAKALKKTETKPVRSGKWTLNQPVNDESQAADTFMPRYFFTHGNFYAITQYNHSVLYAMAVHDLSLAIAEAKQLFDAEQRAQGAYQNNNDVQINSN